MYLSRSLSVCLSVSSFLSLPSFSCSLCLSAHISLTVTVSICDSLAPSIFLFLPLPVYLYLPYLFLLSSAVLCRPLSHSVFPSSCMCLFISFYTSLSLLSPPDAVCLWLSLLRSTRLLLCFLPFLPPFVSLHLYPVVWLSISPLPLCLSRYSCRDFLTC